MGTLLDTTVFIELERAIRRVPGNGAMNEVAERLMDQLGPAEEVGIAAITASELLHGVHRAAPRPAGSIRRRCAGCVPTVPIRPDYRTRTCTALGSAGIIRDGRKSARPACRGHRCHSRVARRNS